MKKRLVGAALAMLTVILLANRPVSPEECALCNAENYPNPCLMDLHTGRVEELKVYDTGWYSEDLMYYKAREFSTEQTIGTMSFISCAGLAGVRSTGTYPRCELTLPERPASIRKTYYCRACRQLLSQISAKGYVVLDTYDLENKGVYPVREGAHYTLRCFEITVEEGLLTVEGTMEVVEGGSYGRGLLRP